ncbi:MAG: hypothetical protein DRP46_08405 [Candidatus Zixiibacteriota bacterium]|nr:MAG: hypothetical protein DRP46_08405 [candidate division Zixibacteria bacterium]
MKSISVIIKKSDFDVLNEHLYKNRNLESGAMAFFNKSEGNNKVKLLISKLKIPKENDFLARSSSAISFKPEFTESCHSLCESEYLHLLDIHTHPWSNSVEFSPIDDREAIKTKIPYLEQYVPNTAIAFIVFGNDINIASARYWDLESKEMTPISNIIVI